tara:strand:- start:363 stop:1415 length:1053 start_codon:yes stop_codon:yes gene_type:complete
MQNILVTGGAGYIGFHTSYFLLEKSYNIFILDNLSNSLKKNIDFLENKYNKVKKNFYFFEKDIKNYSSIKSIFEYAAEINKPIDSVIHFAGLKSVSESIDEPLKYWKNNVVGSINLFNVMNEFNCNNIVFSSTACVYGKENIPPFPENSIINPENPYGNTKATVESILINLFDSNPEKWNIGILRYFNPIGSIPYFFTAENFDKKTSNIFPLLCKAAFFDDFIFTVNGNNWDTIDGSGVRDYIHINDLVNAHYLTLKYLFENKSMLNKIVLNLGTGEGTSVLELIKIIEMVSGKKINYNFGPKRHGDLAITVADNTLARKILNWAPEKSIIDMCRDGWSCYSKNFLDDKI